MGYEGSMGRGEGADGVVIKRVQAMQEEEQI